MNGDDGDDDDIFVYTGRELVPRDVRRAKIDGSVDSIPDGAFTDCRQLIEVVGHNKLKKVEEYAFSHCRSLRRLTKMNGVKEIERNAFFGCHALSDLDDFVKLEIIEHHAFNRCSLKFINMPSLRRVGVCAFAYCTALTDAVFGEDLGRIDRCAFNGCTALRRIAIPLRNDLIIAWDAFDLCENLSRVDVIGGIQKTISSLQLKSWRNEMKEEIERINQTLPGTRSAEKPAVIRQWIRSVIDRMKHYKTEHQIVLKEAMTLLELALWKANLDETESGVHSQEGVRVTRRQVKRARKERCITSGAGIIIKNVLPFLELDE